VALGRDSEGARKSRKACLRVGLKSGEEVFERGRKKGG